MTIYSFHCLATSHFALSHTADRGVNCPSHYNAAFITLPLSRRRGQRFHNFSLGVLREGLRGLVEHDFTPREEAVVWESHADDAAVRQGDLSLSEGRRSRFLVRGSEPLGEETDELCTEGLGEASHRMGEERSGGTHPPGGAFRTFWGAMTEPSTLESWLSEIDHVAPFVEVICGSVLFMYI